MSLLISFLIIVFGIIISYQLFLAHVGVVTEGMDGYKEYDTNDPNNAMILAQQNAGNIEVLKGRMDELSGLKQVIIDMSGNITNVQTQVDGLLEAQQDYISQSGVTEPPTVTGATEEGEEEEDIQ
jgi:hypothetical protein